MAVLREHVAYYSEMLALPGFVRDPVLTFGFQDVFMAPNSFKDAADFRGIDKLRWLKRELKERWEVALNRRHPDLRIPKTFNASDLGVILCRHGATEVKTLDLFDKRADYPHDMNEPIPGELAGRFNTVIDIGSIEHVFDTRRCLENLTSLVAVGGHLMLHTPCRGYFDHGLHTLSPECLIQGMEVNGFETRWVRYSTPEGVPLKTPRDAEDAILWVIGQKKREVSPFVNPQQGRWKPAYEGTIQWQWK